MHSELLGLVSRGRDPYIEHGDGGPAEINNSNVWISYRSVLQNEFAYWVMRLERFGNIGRLRMRGLDGTSH